MLNDELGRDNYEVVQIRGGHQDFEQALEW